MNKLNEMIYMLERASKNRVLNIKQFNTIFKMVNIKIDRALFDLDINAKNYIALKKRAYHIGYIRNLVA